MHNTKTRNLKRGAMGRMGCPPGQREALLDEFERSGLNGAAFARAVGISYPTFANWIQKRRHARGDDGVRPGSGRAEAKPGPRWLEAALPWSPVPSPALSLAPAMPAAPLALELPCGTRMLVGDARQAALAAQLLLALQSLQSSTPSAPC